MTVSIPCFGQTQGENPNPTPLPTPAPYEKNEFPQWMKDLRRAEIIMIGSFPFTFFVSVEMFQLYRYAYYNFDANYAPWPVTGPETLAYEEQDKMNIILTAVTLSVSIAIADYIIVKVTQGKNPKVKPKK